MIVRIFGFGEEGTASHRDHGPVVIIEGFEVLPPMKVIRETKLSGMTDPRIISLGLIALMIVLYFWLR